MYQLEMPGRRTEVAENYIGGVSFIPLTQLVWKRIDQRLGKRRGHLRFQKHGCFLKYQAESMRAAPVRRDTIYHQSPEMIIQPAGFDKLRDLE